MCWSAFSAMAFALLPFVPYYTARFSELTWQISSTLFAVSVVCFVWLTYFKSKKLSAASSAHLSSGWMLTYQSGSILIALILAANALSLLGTAGPAAYLAALGWHVFMASSLFVRLLMGPGGTIN
jgi:hypothetical protein